MSPLHLHFLLSLEGGRLIPALIVLSSIVNQEQPQAAVSVPVIAALSLGAYWANTLGL